MQWLTYMYHLDLPFLGRCGSTLIKWELTKWEIDQMGIDQMGIDQMGIDKVGRYRSLIIHAYSSSQKSSRSGFVQQSVYD